jgi:hypothetical protein
VARAARRAARSCSSVPTAACESHRTGVSIDVEEHRGDLGALSQGLRDLLAQRRGVRLRSRADLPHALAAYLAGLRKLAGQLVEAEAPARDRGRTLGLRRLRARGRCLRLRRGGRRFRAGGGPQHPPEHGAVAEQSTPCGCAESGALGRQYNGAHFRPILDPLRPTPTLRVARPGLRSGGQLWADESRLFYRVPCPSSPLPGSLA